MPLLRINREKKYLEVLVRDARKLLSDERIPNLRLVDGAVEETDADVDGYWAPLAKIQQPSVQISMFLDRSLDTLSMWYGVSSRSKATIDHIDDLALGRWPGTQHVPLSSKGRYDGLRFSDPVRELYDGEYYYG